MFKLKKISFFLPHPGDGGLTNVMLSIAKGLALRDYNIQVITKKSNSTKNLLKDLFKKNNIDDLNIKITYLNFKRTITSLGPLAKHLKKDDSSILISGGPQSNCIALLAKIISKASVKVLITEHSIPSIEVYNTGRTIDRILPLLMKVTYPKSDEIIAVSNTVADDLATFINYPRESINIIYNPITDNSILKKSNTEIAHPWFNKDETPIIIFVGRLAKVKNIPLLIEAFSLVKRNTKCRLVIIGEGPEKSNLIQLSQQLNLTDYIDFIGYSNNPYPYIQQADLLVLCSLWEGFGNVIVEALACGTNVVATNNLLSAKEILNNGEFGLLADNTSISLANAIQELIEGSVNFTNLKDRADLFSVESSIKKYELLIKKYL